MMRRRSRKPLAAGHLQVLEGIQLGLSYPEIAQRMNRSVRTVKTYAAEANNRLDMPYPLNTVLLAVYLNCELFQIGIKELQRGAIE